LVCVLHALIPIIANKAVIIAIYVADKNLFLIAAKFWINTPELTNNYAVNAKCFGY